MENLRVKSYKIFISNEQILAPGEHTSDALSPKILHCLVHNCSQLEPTQNQIKPFHTPVSYLGHKIPF